MVRLWFVSPSVLTLIISVLRKLALLKWFVCGSFGELGKYTLLFLFQKKSRKETGTLRRIVILREGYA